MEPPVEISAAERQALMIAGVDMMVSRLPLSYVPRALTGRETRRRIKLVADRRTNHLVGAHVLATEAGEMIQKPTLAIKHGISVDDLAAAFHPYLTLGARLSNPERARSRRVALRAPRKHLGNSAGEAGLLGACRHFSDTLLAEGIKLAAQAFT